MKSSTNTRHSLPDNAVRAVTVEVATGLFYQSVAATLWVANPVQFSCGESLMATLPGLIVFFLAAPSTYEVAGHILPETPAAVSLHGTTTPFTTSTESDDAGRFTFKKLDPRTYTLSIVLA